jgi:hypothetical protein
MLHIVSLISTKNIVEIVYDREMTDGFKSALATNHAGGDVSLLSFYRTTEAEEIRVRKNDEYVLTWVGDEVVSLDFSAEDSRPWLRVETSRGTVKADAPADLALSSIGVWSAGTYNQGDYTYRNNAIFRCTKTSTTQTPTVSATDWSKTCSAVLMTLTALNFDKTTVISNFNKLVTIPVTDNAYRSIPLLCQFASGVCTVVIAYKSISECGSWLFPSSSDDIFAEDLTDLTKTKINVLDQEIVNVILPF